jgi:hypothetical protein
MVYDSDTRRIRLLGEEDGSNPLERYDFGSAPELFVDKDKLDG